MKNFETIMSETGIAMTDEQKTAALTALQENYKPVADWQNQHDSVLELTEQLRVARETLDKFEGVDPEQLTGEIATLKQTLKDKETEYQNGLADRDFNDLLKDSIASVNGKNAKAITALLDVDTLKKSKNQKEDVAAALKVLAEAEDSKMLFGEPAPNPVGTGNVIGTVGKSGGGDALEASMRAAMGLPPVADQK